MGLVEQGVGGPGDHAGQQQVGEVAHACSVDGLGVVLCAGPGGGMEDVEHLGDLPELDAQGHTGGGQDEVGRVVVVEEQEQHQAAHGIAHHCPLAETLDRLPFEGVPFFPEKLDEGVLWISVGGIFEQVQRDHGLCAFQPFGQ